MVKKNLIFLGLGKNQIKYIRQVNRKKNFIIGLDKNNKNKSFVDFFIRHSVYNPNIKNIQDKLKRFNVEQIIYRSSGPTILLAYALEKFYHIKRIHVSLAKSIYSKSYFSDFLKKNKFKFIKYKFIKNLKDNNFKQLKVLKPDSPLIGKKNVYIAKFFKRVEVNDCVKNSHNKKVIINDFIEGRDINLFYKVSKNKKIKLIFNFEEINITSNNYINPNKTKIMSPANINLVVLNKINKICTRLIKKFNDYYGLISITCRSTPLNEVIPYEINIGLSGDNVADKIYPKIYKKNLYKIELKTLINNYIY
jgi:hypothetical protein